MVDQAKLSDLSESESDERRLSESVYETLTQMIVSGELEPGRPVSESALSRRLEVSRTPVHEAVGRLVQDGLVIQPRNRRPVVASFSADDIFDVFEMRRILESEAAAKAATRMDKVTLGKLREAAQKFQGTRGKQASLQSWVEFDDLFHTAIAVASGSRRLQEDIQRYRLLHRVFNRMHTDPSVLKPALEEHLQILAAIGQRDAEQARSAMNEHIAEWQRFFVRHLA